LSGDQEEDAPTTPGAAPELSKLEEALHTPFVVQLGDDTAVALTLEEITTSGNRPGWESFALIFDGPSPAAFMDGLFEVEHAELGRFAVFVAAVHTDGDGQQYEAVFNRPST
jgi:hypothetical protein